MAVAKKTSKAKAAKKVAAIKTKSIKASKVAVKVAPAKRAASVTKRATTAAGRLPVNLTLSQAKRVQLKLSKVDASFKFLDDKIANA